jgi:hypothetical protein
MINKLKTCTDLLMEFEDKNIKSIGEKLTFVGIEDRDVYNITKPFLDNGEMIIAGRVESRDSEISEVKFFKESETGVWVKVHRTIELHLQDPFVTKIHGELVLGGVETFPHPILQNCLGYRTVFYRGKDINSLVRFTCGCELMKDIRLLELTDKRILVFTRPQGIIGGRGRIAYTIIDNLDQLNAGTIESAQLLPTQFIESEWGGANALFILKNGLIGVLGHVCYFDDMMKRHYYSMTFSFNLETREVSPIKIIATRKNFKEGDCKREDIRDVIFSGGINRLQNGKMAEFFVGVSDVEGHKILIEDPFLEYENQYIA